MIAENQKTDFSQIPYKKYLTSLGIFVSLVIAILYFIYTGLSRPPANFPENSQLTINFGSDVKTIVNQFAENNYVKSKLLLYLAIATSHDAKDIKAGTYYFTKPVRVSEVARIITEVGPKDKLVKLTIPEGVSLKKIAETATMLLKNFDEGEFDKLTENKEGYLFPDTYFVPTHYTTEELFNLLTETFTERILPVISSANNTKLTNEEIIILASILEREANSLESMSLVSSVLQNRLAINMPLQADATIEYVLNKPLKELVPKDLEIDSPYNTYLNIGLPPTPIGNPGLDAIMATLNPQTTDYYYYITDPEGDFHFAKTFAEHKLNIARYLR